MPHRRRRAARPPRRSTSHDAQNRSPVYRRRPVASSHSTIAEREHVAAPIERLAAALLGRHVRELALERAGAGLGAARARRARDAEVEQLDAAVVGDEHVRAARRRGARCRAACRRRHAARARSAARRRRRSRSRARARAAARSPRCVGRAHQLPARPRRARYSIAKKYCRRRPADVVDLHDVRVMQRAPRGAPRRGTSPRTRRRRRARGRMRLSDHAASRSPRCRVARAR